MYITLLYEDNYAIQFLDPSSQPTDGCGVSRGTLPASTVTNCCCHISCEV